MKVNALLVVGAGILASTVIVSSSCYAVTDKATSESDRKQEGEKTQDVGKAIEGRKAHEGGKLMGGEARSQAHAAINEQRKKIIDEAVSAIAETKNALRALDEKKTQDALPALERASGKLNVVLARDPNLALAPIDVDVTVYDVYTTLDAVKKARKQAEDNLEDGEVQKARLLIRDLASEMVISLINVPLQTYPTAIGAVAPLIDQGKIDEAKAALEAALNTLVAVDHVIALPILRADVKLARAEGLSRKEGRSDEDNKTLARLLNEAREQLKFAEALGYGNKKDYKKFYSEIDDIEGKTKLGKSGKDFFDKMKAHLSEFSRALFG
jgi:hypothetical protein